MRMTLSERTRLWLRARRFRNRSEREEVHFACSAIQPGDCVLDIGANKGGYTYWMSKIAGPSGRVYAFEPQPKLVDYLKSFAAGCRHQNLIVCPVALSNCEGQGNLVIPQHCGWAKLIGDDQATDPVVSVPLVTLDGYLAAFGDGRRIGFLKCDVEGHETAVFQGASRLLDNARPVILFETTPLTRARAGSIPAIALLESFGYEGYFFCGKQLLPLQAYDPANHRLTNDIIQNYVFLHPSQSRLVQARHPYGVGRLESTRAAA